MPALQLREYEPCRISASLDGNQLEALRQARVEIRPAGPGGDQWELRPSSWVGMVTCGNLSVVIRPRIPIDRIMFLVGYSLNPRTGAPLPST